MPVSAPWIPLRVKNARTSLVPDQKPLQLEGLDHLLPKGEKIPSEPLRFMKHSLSAFSLQGNIWRAITFWNMLHWYTFTNINLFDKKCWTGKCRTRKLVTRWICCTEKGNEIRTLIKKKHCWNKIVHHSYKASDIIAVCVHSTIISIQKS